MKNFLCWTLRLVGIASIVVQLFKYANHRVNLVDELKEKTFFYDLAYLVGYNLFLLIGVVLIFISIAIGKKNHSTDRRI